MKKWIGIATVLIVLLGAGLFFMQGEPEKTASSNSNSETAAPEKPDYVRELAENMTLEEKVGPVSYTHLDVYKRQCKCCGISSDNPIIAFKGVRIS